MESCQPTPQEREYEPEQASMTRTGTGLNIRADQEPPKTDEVPTTRLASEAAIARFEQAFVNEYDRFPAVGPPNKDTLGTP